MLTLTLLFLLFLLFPPLPSSSLLLSLVSFLVSLLLLFLSFLLLQARIISGEEEAIYGWTAINYLMGTLISNDSGFGAVSAPNKTFGALDMGGASAQISFFQPDEDVVANLFKMQVASKHWNVYGHSFLYFGADLARERMGARIVYAVDVANGATGITGDSPLYTNPCLPTDRGGEFESKIHFAENGIESWLGLSDTGRDAEK